MQITFGVIANHFGKVIRNIANHSYVICESLFAKRPLFRRFANHFLGPHHKYSSFLDTFYVYIIRNCESLCQNVSQFHKNCVSLFVSQIQPCIYIYKYISVYITHIITNITISHKHI